VLDPTINGSEAWQWESFTILGPGIEERRLLAGNLGDQVFRIRRD
jgi:hypothetical protein